MALNIARDHASPRAGIGPNVCQAFPSSPPFPSVLRYSHLDGLRWTLILSGPRLLGCISPPFYSYSVPCHALPYYYYVPVWGFGSITLSLSVLTFCFSFLDLSVFSSHVFIYSSLHFTFFTRSPHIFFGPTHAILIFFSFSRNHAVVSYTLCRYVTLSQIPCSSLSIPSLWHTSHHIHPLFRSLPLPHSCASVRSVSTEVPMFEYFLFLADFACLSWSIVVVLLLSSSEFLSPATLSPPPLAWHASCMTFT